jgi:MFS family permease
MKCILAVAYGAGYIVNFSDIVPAYSSVVFGITTAAATVGALMSNIIAGLVIKSPVLEDWRKLFILFTIIYFIGGLVYALFGSAVPLEWAIHKSQEKQEADDQIPGETSVLMQPLEATKAPET